MRCSLLIVAALTTIVAGQGSGDWATQCSAIEQDKWLIAGGLNSTTDWSQIFVGPERLPGEVATIDAAWGITYEACRRDCAGINAFSFSNFSSGTTNWLFPFLALAAQLPYETPTPLQDVMSALLAVGSPMLITYSLVLTMRMRSRIRDNFNRLIRDAEQANIDATRPGYVKMLKAAQVLCEETLQVPMRACELDGLLSSLVARQVNRGWWDIAEERLRSSQRGVTASLIIQNLIAIVAWIFTVIVAIEFPVSVGTTNALALSALWIWIVPEVTCWVKVGTQSRANSVYDALHAARLALEQPDQQRPFDAQQRSRPRSSRGSIVVAPGLVDKAFLADDTSTISDQTLTQSTAAPRLGSIHQSTTFHTLTPQHIAALTGSHWTGAEGDEGPINNHARFNTHYAFCQTLEIAFRSLIVHSQRDTNAISNDEMDKDVVSRALRAPLCPLSQQPLALERYVKRCDAYLPWSMLPVGLKWDVAAAVLMAILLQWGTTGPAIMIAWYSPPIGFGCRSASYVSYGVLSTIAFLLQVSASALSHQLMLRHQAEKPSGRLPRLSFHTLRLLGNTLGAVNGLWLVLLSVLQISTAYDTCWCNSNWLSGHGKYGVWLFRSSFDVYQFINSTWGGGVAFSAISCISVTIVVWLGANSGKRPTL